MKNKRKTIIGFDSWTAGAHHFERLVPALKSKGYRLVLIHIGSWGHDKNRPKEEMIGELLVRDISYYGNQSFEKILELENPNAVLFLSTRAFAHMTFNRYADYRNIPTCHLYHGLVKVQAVNQGEQTFRVNYTQHLYMLLTRTWKNVSKLIPCYVSALIYTAAPKKIWFDFFATLFGKVRGGYQKQEFYEGTQTRIGCVYVNADVEHMSRNYGIPNADIYVVGNPDLVMFGLKAEFVGFALGADYSRKKLVNSLEKPYILYIDTALSKCGIVFSLDDDFIKHLVETKNALGLTGYRLTVKLHPAHLQSKVPQLLEDLGVELCSNEDFIPRLKSAAAAIIEPSSAAIIPAMIGLPILMARYGKLSGQLYGEVLTTYPRARFIDAIDHIREILEEERISVSTNLVYNWIEENAGPLPAEEMPKRVAEAIHQMVQKSELPRVS